MKPKINSDEKKRIYRTCLLNCIPLSSSFNAVTTHDKQCEKFQLKKLDIVKNNVSRKQCNLNDTKILLQLNFNS